LRGLLESQVQVENPLSAARLAAAIAGGELTMHYQPILDLRAIGATVQVVQAAKRPALIVLNAAPPPRGSTQAAITAEARRALAAYPVPVAPVAIASRAALSHALVGGLAVTEFEPAGKASVEMQALFTIVRKALWPNARK